jgi:hypothetical protein
LEKSGIPGVDDGSSLLLGFVLCVLPALFDFAEGLVVTTSVFSSSVRKPFGVAAALWAVVAVALCRIFTANHAAFILNLFWMAGLYLLSVLDLVALGKTVQGALAIAAGNRAGSAIQTFYWFGLKLACLGIFILAMMSASHLGKATPTPGLLVGVGTVTMIPLLGGLFWSWVAHE